MTAVAKAAQKLALSLAEAAQDLEALEEAKKGFGLVNKTFLLKSGLTEGDIEKLRQFHGEDRKHPLYQLKDAQRYIDSRKLKKKTKLNRK